MSALRLKIITILCLYFTVLTDAETTRVVWKHVGEDITIQCRGSDEESLNLYRGLNKAVKLFFTEKSNKFTYGNEIKGRSQINGAFPNVDILIKNLSLNDLGPYWCEYKKMGDNGNMEIKNGQGSVLLVVMTTGNKEECKPSDQNLVLVSAVIAGAVLLVMVVFILWIIFKPKSSSTTKKPRRAVTNDVYEDMRGTMRR